MAPSKQETSAFIRSSFRSVWDLEMLCYLRRRPEHSHAPVQMVADLRASDLVVANSLAGLLAAGLIVLEPDGSARYAPATEELERLCAAVDSLYSRSPDAVRRMIVTAASPGLSAFAEAFRIRKD